MHTAHARAELSCTRIGDWARNQSTPQPRDPNMTDSRFQYSSLGLHDSLAVNMKSAGNIALEEVLSNLPCNLNKLARLILDGKTLNTHPRSHMQCILTNL